VVRCNCADEKIHSWSGFTGHNPNLITGTDTRAKITFAGLTPQQNSNIRKFSQNPTFFCLHPKREIPHTITAELIMAIGDVIFHFLFISSPGKGERNRLPVDNLTGGVSARERNRWQ
jgi:hypothetical protein